MERLAYIVIGGAIGVVLTIALQAWFGAGPSLVSGPPALAMAEMSMIQAEARVEPIEDAGTTAQSAKTDMSGMGAMHQHPMRPTSLDAPVPTVTHLVFPDRMDGYNVQILPRNFRFTPASVNRKVQNNEGHAHIYVNGTKIARIYAEWIHLPSALFQPGENLVRVTLNANDHSEWSVDGVPIASTVRVLRPSDNR